jgi:hypothetical protein
MAYGNKFKKRNNYRTKRKFKRSNYNKKPFFKRQRTLVSNRVYNKSIMPDRFRTMAWLQMSGQIDKTGFNPVSGFGSLNISANDPISPFNIINAMPNPLTLKLSDGMLITDSPLQLPDVLATVTGLYNRYRVLASSIRFKYITVSATNNAEIVLAPSTTVTNYAHFADIARAPLASSVVMITPNATALENSTIRKYLSTSKVFGVERAAVQIESDYTATRTTSPVNLWTWAIGINVATPGVITNDPNFNCEVKYWLELFNRIDEQEP